jgi:hypothetical protein
LVARCATPSMLFHSYLLRAWRNSLHCILSADAINHLQSSHFHVHLICGLSHIDGISWCGGAQAKPNFHRLPNQAKPRSPNLDHNRQFRK